MGLLLSHTHLHGENNSPQSMFDTDWLWYSAFQQNYKHSNLPIFVETLLGKNCDKCHCIEMATQDCWNGGEQHMEGLTQRQHQKKLKYIYQI